MADDKDTLQTRTTDIARKTSSFPHRTLLVEWRSESQVLVSSARLLVSGLDADENSKSFLFLSGGHIAVAEDCRHLLQHGVVVCRFGG